MQQAIRVIRSYQTYRVADDWIVDSRLRHNFGLQSIELLQAYELVVVGDQLFLHVANRRKSLFWVLLDHSIHDFIEICVVWRSGRDAPETSALGDLSCKHLIENKAQRVDVSLAAHLFASCALFRRRVKEIR